MASSSDRTGKGRTDWKRVDALTDDIERIAAADEENPATGAEHWASARIGLPPRKTRIHASLDADVVDWFKRQGRGFQTA
jgi:uncharacterized protein (DUF4415 family)